MVDIDITLDGDNSYNNNYDIYQTTLDVSSLLKRTYNKTTSFNRKTVLFDAFEVTGTKILYN